jgi:hypothetical protein
MTSRKMAIGGIQESPAPHTPQQYENKSRRNEKRPGGFFYLKIKRTVLKNKAVILASWVTYVRRFRYFDRNDRH